MLAVSVTVLDVHNIVSRPCHIVNHNAESCNMSCHCVIATCHRVFNVTIEGAYSCNVTITIIEGVLPSP